MNDNPSEQPESFLEINPGPQMPSQGLTPEEREKNKAYNPQEAIRAQTDESKPLGQLLAKLRRSSK